ncbi:zf-RVT domain-containing protein, partial [Cephalotus follicularis]
QIFLWKVNHNKLLTNQVRLRHLLTISPQYSRCMADVENCVHILRECHPSNGTWQSLDYSHHDSSFHSSKLFTWTKFNANHVDLDWKYMFVIALWSLWKAQTGWIC